MLCCFLPFWGRKFLSTLSLRRATPSGSVHAGDVHNFYPRSPCGERLAVSVCFFDDLTISIHALLAESDLTGPKETRALMRFLSTLSLRRATNIGCQQFLVAGGNFYPRSPCGERQRGEYYGLFVELFLSTLSLRRATVLFWETVAVAVYISIHALLAESDPPVRDIIQWEGIFLSTLSLRRATSRRGCRCGRQRHFYPRSPCGERPPLEPFFDCFSRFLSTLSLRRATPHVECYAAGLHDFYPRSPCGERRWQ